jgi:hypothetical protein
MCVITAREQLQNYTLHKFLVGMYPELLSTYKAVYSTKTLYRMKEYFSIHYYRFVGFSSLESLIIVFIWALRIKQWVHTGCPESHLPKVFSYISAISFNFINNFFKNYRWLYRVLFVWTTFHTTLQNYHLWSKYENFAFSRVSEHSFNKSFFVYLCCFT